MTDINSGAKYLVTKRRNTGDRGVYTVHISNDSDLWMHIQGTFNNTDHEILSVINLKPEIKA